MRKLFIFNNSQIPGWGDCYSITDDGVILGNHICSDSRYMKNDLHDATHRFEVIQKYFNGEQYELVIIPDNEVKTHPELDKACKLAGKNTSRYHKYQNKKCESTLQLNK
jgi:hypothetical protein